MKFVAISLVSMSTFHFALAQQVARSEISFNRDVRPIFSETCFNCHGPDEASREEDLRFDIPESAFAEREGGYATRISKSSFCPLPYCGSLEYPSLETPPNNIENHNECYSIQTTDYPTDALVDAYANMNLTLDEAR